jgi:hypothetical protein
MPPQPRESSPAPVPPPPATPAAARQNKSRERKGAAWRPDAPNVSHHLQQPRAAALAKPLRRVTH